MRYKYARPLKRVVDKRKRILWEKDKLYKISSVRNDTFFVETELNNSPVAIKAGDPTFAFYGVIEGGKACLTV